MWHVLLRYSLNFCSWTTLCLDLDDLARINRAWLHKESKVSVVQAIAMLAMKTKCLTWNQRSSDSVLTGGNILLLDFLFSRSKASNANNGTTPNIVCLWKTRMGQPPLSDISNLPLPSKCEHRHLLPWYPLIHCPQNVRNTHFMMAPSNKK